MLGSFCVQGAHSTALLDQQFWHLCGSGEAMKVFHHILWSPQSNHASEALYFHLRVILSNFNRLKLLIINCWVSFNDNEFSGIKASSSRAQVISKVSYHLPASHKNQNVYHQIGTEAFQIFLWVQLRYSFQVSVMGALIGVSSAEFEGKKSVKRGIDDFGYPVGYNGWAASLKLNPLYNAPLLNYDK